MAVSFSDQCRMKAIATNCRGERRKARLDIRPPHSRHEHSRKASFGSVAVRRTVQALQSL